MKTSLALGVSAIALTSASAAPLSVRISEPSSESSRPDSPSGLHAREIAPTPRPAEQIFIDRSIVIHDGSNWTLIPHGAILHLPEALQSKIGGRPLGNLLSWREFMTLNRAWLGSEEVSLRQAEGTAPMDPRRTEFIARQRKMIVAVRHGGPISVAVSDASAVDSGNS